MKQLINVINCSRETDLRRDNDFAEDFAIFHHAQALNRPSRGRTLSMTGSHFSLLDELKKRLEVVVIEAVRKSHRCDPDLSGFDQGTSRETAR